MKPFHWTVHIITLKYIYLILPVDFLPMHDFVTSCIDWKYWFTMSCRSSRCGHISFYKIWDSIITSPLISEKSFIIENLSSPQGCMYIFQNSNLHLKAWILSLAEKTASWFCWSDRLFDHFWEKSAKHTSLNNYSLSLTGSFQGKKKKNDPQWRKPITRLTRQPHECLPPGRHLASFCTAV